MGAGYGLVIIKAKNLLGDTCHEGVTVRIDMEPKDDLWKHECTGHAPVADHWCEPGHNISDGTWRLYGGLCRGKDHYNNGCIALDRWKSPENIRSVLSTAMW